MRHLTVMAGRRQSRCLLSTPTPARMRAVQATLAGLFATEGVVPEQLQTDRGPRFIGTEADTPALPSRLMLWLAGLGVTHRLIPVRRPQVNGAVARLHHAMEYSWRGEEDGLAALARVWNVARPPLSEGHLSEGHRPYRGRAGFDLDAVWALLGPTRVRRRVDRQGKLSLWDHPVWVGARGARQTVTVRFDPDAREAVIRDDDEPVLRRVRLPWLTEDWLWEWVPLAHQLSPPSDSSMVR